MSFGPFFSYPAVDSKDLPLTLMSLDDWILVRITGKDSEKYLQSQLTVDVSQMKKNQHLIAAHCNPQGKMLSNLHLFRCGEDFSFIERRSLCDIQLSEMKKYAVFSKVFFRRDENAVLLGVAGFNARTALTALFRELPTLENQVVNDAATVLLWFKYPSERFLLITDETIAERITKELNGKVKLSNSQQWLALNIEAGIPTIDIANSGRFIPQSVNMQEIGGINFKKGCYIGQEIIMRTQCRGANKRSMLCLTGFGMRLPKICEDIEKKIDNNWKRVGTVLASVQLVGHRLLVQAVTNSHIESESNSIFRIQDCIDVLHVKTRST